MIQFLKITILILLSIFLFSCSGSYEPPKHLIRHPQINLEISLNKSEYLEGEPIWLTAKFKNEGEKIDSLADLDEYIVYARLNIISDSTSPVKYYGPAIDRFYPFYVKIEPKQEISIVTNVCRYWMNKFIDWFSFKGYMLSGEYEIQSFYGSGWLNDDVRLQSNKLFFKVIKPLDYESEAFGNYVSLFKSRYGQADSLFKFYNNYDSSIYAEYAFYYYSYIKFMDRDKEKIDTSFISECFSFIDKYPNSFYLYPVFDYCQKIYFHLYDNIWRNYTYFMYSVKSKYPYLSEYIDKLIEIEFKRITTEVKENR